MKNYLNEYLTTVTLLMLATLLLIIQQTKLSIGIVFVFAVVFIVILFTVLTLKTESPYTNNIIVIKKMIIEFIFWILIGTLIYLSKSYIDNYDVLLTYWFLPSLCVNLIILRLWVKLYNK